MSLDLFQQPDDVIVQHKGDSMIALAGPRLQATGWRGGQWVRYVDPGSLVDDFVVEASDGNEASAFLIFPSEGYGIEADWGAVGNYTGMVLRSDNGSGNSTVAIMAGGGRQLFRVYETTALTIGGTRTGPPAVYTLNEDLKLSERGYLCSDPDINLAAAGVTNPQIVGKCCLVPAQRNVWRLGLDLKY